MSSPSKAEGTLGSKPEETLVIHQQPQEQHQEQTQEEEQPTQQLSRTHDQVQGDDGDSLPVETPALSTPQVTSRPPVTINQSSNLSVSNVSSVTFSSVSSHSSHRSSQASVNPHSSSVPVGMCIDCTHVRMFMCLCARFSLTVCYLVFYQIVYILYNL